MSQERIRLLEYTAYDQFGSACGEIAAVLLRRGTLPLDQLQRLTSLPRKMIQQGLIILSLHDCLHHARPLRAGGAELYEINQNGLQQRMRGGRYAQMAFERGGEVWSSIVETCWREGMAKPEEMIEDLKLNLAETGQPKLEEFALEDLMAAEALRVKQAKEKGKGKEKKRKADDEPVRETAPIESAHVARLIVVVTDGSRSSVNGLNTQWEQDLRKNLKGVITAKQIKEIKKQLDTTRAEWEDNERKLGKGIDIASKEGDNAPRKVKARKTKQDTVFGESSTAVASNGTRFIPDAWYRINPEQFHIQWRNELIVTFAAERLNVAASDVLRTILELVEPSIESMAAPQSRSVTSNEIYAALESAKDKKVSLEKGLAKVSRDKSWQLENLSKKMLLPALCNILATADSTALVRTTAFLSTNGNSMSANNNFKVEFAEIAGRMKRCLVEAMIEQKLGSDGVRCWRILEARGKLDEKHLAKMAFLTVKDTRENISKLAAASFIEPQEVPRSADRAPSRTFFLWFVDYPKVIQALLRHHYKALAAIQAQKDYQLGAKKALVEKRNKNRFDDSGLTVSDRFQLKELEKVLEALTVGEMRIDQDIFVLRDMDPTMVE